MPIPTYTLSDLGKPLMTDFQLARMDADRRREQNLQRLAGLQASKGFMFSPDKIRNLAAAQRKMNLSDDELLARHDVYDTDGAAILKEEALNRQSVAMVNFLSDRLNASMFGGHESSLQLLDRSLNWSDVIQHAPGAVASGAVDATTAVLFWPKYMARQQALSVYRENKALITSLSPTDPRFRRAAALYNWARNELDKGFSSMQDGDWESMFEQLSERLYPSELRGRSNVLDILAATGQMAPMLAAASLTGGAGAGAIGFAMGMREFARATAGDPDAGKYGMLPMLLYAAGAGVLDTFPISRMGRLFRGANAAKNAAARSGRPGMLADRAGAFSRSPLGVIAAEGVTEGMQSLWLDTVRRFSTNENQGLSLAQAFREGGIGAGAAAVMMSALGARAMYRAGRQQAQIRHKAEATALASSRKMGDVPDGWVKKAVDYIANNRQVFVSTDALRVYWQERGVPQEQMIEHLNTVSDGLGDAFALAEQTGGNVPIDAGLFFDQVAKNDGSEILIDNFSFDPVSPTQTQDSEDGGAIDERHEAMIDGALRRAFVMTEEMQAAYNDIVTQIEAATRNIPDMKGRPLTMSHTGKYAGLIINGAAARAEQTGMPFGEFWKRYRIHITNDLIDRLQNGSLRNAWNQGGRAENVTWFRSSTIQWSDIDETAVTPNIIINSRFSDGEFTTEKRNEARAVLERKLNALGGVIKTKYLGDIAVPKHGGLRKGFIAHYAEEGYENHRVALMMNLPAVLENAYPIAEDQTVHPKGGTTMYRYAVAAATDGTQDYAVRITLKSGDKGKTWGFYTLEGHPYKTITAPTLPALYGSNEPSASQAPLRGSNLAKSVSELLDAVKTDSFALFQAMENGNTRTMQWHTLPDNLTTPKTVIASQSLNGKFTQKIKSDARKALTARLESQSNIVHSDTLGDISFSGNDIRRLFNFRLVSDWHKNLRAKTLENLPEILDNAVEVAAGQTTNTKGKTITYRYAAASATDGTQDYAVWITLESNDNGGQWRVNAVDGWPMAERSSGPDSIVAGLIETARNGDYDSFRPNNNNVPRGAFFTDPETGEFRIALSDNADLSTILHETAHWFLTIHMDISRQENAPQSIRDDIQTLLDWFGIKTVEEIQTRHHEQFARGFEKYLMEGVAPVSKLKSVFRAFKRWLSWVYRGGGLGDVQLTDEVRRVFDRMVTSENLAESTTVDRETLSEAERAELTEDEAAEYQDMLNDELGTLKEDIDAAIRHEDALLAGEEGQRILQEERERVREDLLNDRVREALDGMEAVSQGADPDAAAAAHGFDTVEDMERAATVENANIEKEAEAMAREAALERLRETEEVTSPEPRAIEKRLRRAEKELQLAIKARDRYKAKLENLEEAQKADRAAAKASLASLPPRSAIQESVKSRLLSMRARDLHPQSHLSNARRAATKATIAAAGKRWDDVVQFRMDRLISEVAYREAMALERKLKQLHRLVKRARKDSFRKNIGKSDSRLVDGLDYLLAASGFAPQTAHNLSRISVFEDRIDGDGARVNGLMSDLEQAGIILRLPDHLLERKNTDPSRQTVAQLLDLQDAVKSIAHAAKKLAGESTDYDGKTLDEAARETAQQIINRHGIKDAPLGGERRTLPGRAVSLLRSAFSRPDTEMTLLAGDNSLLHKHILTPLEIANANYQNELNAVKASIDQLHLRYYDRDTLRKMGKRDIDVFGTMRTKFELLEMAQHLGTESNRQAMFTSEEFVRLGITEARFVDFLSRHFTETDWQFIQARWDAIDENFSRVDAVYRKASGLPLEKQVATPLQTPFGILRGGYWPLKYRDTPGVKGRDAQWIDEDDGLGGGGAKFYSSIYGRPSFTVRRVGSGRRNIDFNPSTFSNHIQRELYFIHMHQPIVNAYRLLNSQPVRDAMVGTGNMDAIRLLNQWLQDTKAGRLRQDGWNAVFNRIITTSSTAAMGYNVLTAIKQLSGLAGPATVDVGFENMTHGLYELMGDIRGKVREVHNASAVMKARAGRMAGYVVDMQDANVMTWFTNSKAGREAWRMIGYTQGLADMVTWLGARRKAVNELGMTDAEANHYADNMVIRVQGPAEFLSRSAIERGTLGGAERSAVIRAFVQYLSYSITKANSVMRQVDKYRHNEISAGKLAWGLANIIAVEAIVTALLSWDWPDEEESIAYWSLRQSFYGLLGAVPIAGTGLESYLRGYSNTPTWLETTVVQPARAVSLSGQALISDGNVDPDRLAKAWIGAIGGVTGLPAAQMGRTLDAINRSIDGEDVNPVEFLIRDPNARN